MDVQPCIIVGSHFQGLKLNRNERWDYSFSSFRDIYRKQSMHDGTFSHYTNINPSNDPNVQEAFWGVAQLPFRRFMSWTARGALLFWAMSRWMLSCWCLGFLSFNQKKDEKVQSWPWKSPRNSIRNGSGDALIWFVHFIPLDDSSHIFGLGQRSTDQPSWSARCLWYASRTA